MTKEEKKQVTAMIRYQLKDTYDNIRVKASTSEVTGHKIGTPTKYDPATNSGGRLFLGYVTDYVIG